MSEETLNKTSLPVTNAKRSNGSRLIIYLVLLCLLIVTVAFGYGYFQLSRVNLGLARNMNTAHKEVADLQQQMAALQQNIEQLQQDVKTTQDSFSKQLATRPTEDKAASALFSRLSNLNQQIDELVFPTSATTIANTDTAEANQQSAEASTEWQKVWTRIRSSFGSVVTVKYIGNVEPTSYGSTMSASLYRDLHTQLDAAMWAVLYKDTQVYQASIARLVLLVKNHLMTNTEQATKVLQELQSLQQINVTDV